MNRRLTLAAGLLAFAILAFACLAIHAPMIQSELLARSQQALAANRIPAAGLPPGMGVSIDGRDAVLTGPAGSAIVSARAQRVVAAIAGVRVVRARIVNEMAQPSPADARTIPPVPAPLASRQQTQAKLDALLAGRIVEFKTSSAELTPAGTTVLDEVARILAGSSEPCEIQGHTDSSGSADKNFDLSLRRALATENYLASKGIADQRLSVKAFGSAKPIATNGTPEGRQRNRRIEFILNGRP